LIDDLVFENFEPHVRLNLLSDSTSWYNYRPIFSGYSYGRPKQLNVSLLDCFTGDEFTYTDFTTLDDRELRLQVFGYRHVEVEDL